MRQHLGREPGRALETAGDVRRCREEPRRLAERDAVESLHLPPQRALLRAGAELAELRPVELVGLTELVHEPDPLVAVTDDVRRELRRDDEVDRPAVRLVEVEHAPEECLGEHARPGIPLERDGDEVGVVPAGAELLDELVREDLGAAASEGHLGPEDRDPHGGLSSADPRRGAVPAPTRGSRPAVRGRRSAGARPH